MNSSASSSAAGSGLPQRKQFQQSQQQPRQGSRAPSKSPVLPYSFKLPSDQAREQRAKRVAQLRLTFLEKGFSVVGWLFFSNGLSTVLGENETILKLLRYSILLVSVLLMSARWKTSLRALSKGWLLWPVIALMILSMGWTISPSYTMDSIRGEVLPMTAFALYFSSRFNMREQMQIVAGVLGICAALSLFYAVAIPSVGRHVGGKFDGAWRGIYSQKNTFSTTMTMTMLIFFVLGLVNNNRRERILARGALLFSVALILLSTSVSGMVVFLTMLIVVVLSRLFRWKGRRSVLILDVGGMVMLVVGSVLSVTWQSIVIGLGKDPTLSARTHIWTGSIEKIMAQPLLGYGRAAFWVPDSQPAYDVGALAAKGFVPSHAHNGFIDAALELGLLGLGILVVGLLATYGMSLRRAYNSREPEDLWPFTFLTLMVISNMTETVLITRTSPYWVMYMVVFLSIRIWPRRTGQSNPPQIPA
ncbi:MAG: O-antigen ligase family protein [Phormidesmis sp.]